MWFLLMLLLVFGGGWASPFAQRAEVVPREATMEVSSNLKVVGIYGVRNDTSSGVWDIKVNVELAAGALPLDLTRLVIRYSDGATARNYAHAEGLAPDAGAPSEAFDAAWIRGAGSRGVMQAGDLVQLHFNLADHELATRTDVHLLLIPETGSPVAADFRTPATYSTDTVVTLR